jgi:site-specific recombinase XerD
LDWTRLTPETAATIRARLAGAPATINKSLAALRGVARQLFDARLISADDLRRIENATRAVKGSRLPAGRMVEDWELAALLRACSQDASPAGARDAAMIAVAAKTGMRREELVSIRLDAMTVGDGEDFAEVKIIGKGDRERTAFIDGGALAALRDWLAVRGRDGEFLFVPVNKAGVVDTSKGLTTTAAHLVLQKRSAEANVTGMAWHDLRRTVASTLLDKGEDISTVASVLGHAQVETTRKYDRRPEQAKRRAVRKISVPYFSRS